MQDADEQLQFETGGPEETEAWEKMRKKLFERVSDSSDGDEEQADVLDSPNAPFTLDSDEGRFWQLACLRARKLDAKRAVNLYINFARFAKEHGEAGERGILVASGRLFDSFVPLLWFAHNLFPTFSGYLSAGVYDPEDPDTERTKEIFMRGGITVPGARDNKGRLIGVVTSHLIEPSEIGLRVIGRVSSFGRWVMAAIGPSCRSVCSCLLGFSASPGGIFLPALCAEELPRNTEPRLHSHNGLDKFLAQRAL